MDRYGVYPKSWIWLMCSRMAIFFTILAGKMLQLMNTFTIVGVDQMYKIVEDEDRNRPIITYGNHISLIDGYVFASLLKFRYILSYVRIPWALSARDVCHRTKYSSLYFRLIKSPPVDRGAGVYQPSMDFILDRLNHNDWLHLFPEGRINKDEGILPFKPGIARLITESKRLPIILPVVFLGSNDVLPMKKPYRMKTGKCYLPLRNGEMTKWFLKEDFMNLHVTIVVGPPVEFSEAITAAIENGTGDKNLWSNITDELRQCMNQLEERAQTIHSQ